MFAEILLSGLMFFDLLLCPYTKVEESFNLQAMHDILHIKTDIQQYDHLEFPGVVPRTFIGPLFVSIISYPFVCLSNNKMVGQYIVRGCLGFLVLMAFLKFQDAVVVNFGKGVRRWLTLITATQFHFIFYMTRPLPNTFALVFALLATAWWMRQDHKKFIFSSAFVILIFRGELAIYMGIMLLSDLIGGRISIKNTIMYAVPSGIFCLALTIGVDSFFWRRCLWPEGEVLWFNLILNKSSAWGTHPFLWYFNNALPRALGVSVLLVPVGLYLDRRLNVLLLPAFSFVFLYSFLPHKELRFILYVFPVFNTAAAVACDKFWKNRRKKSLLNKVLALASGGHLVANSLASAGFLFISFQNYPGGLALYHFHNIIPPHAKVDVHIDVATAQTGVSRFTQLHQHWRYNKTEDLEPGGADMLRFTHLMIGTSSPQNQEIKPYQHTHKILGAVSGFEFIKFDKSLKMFPLQIVTRPKVFVLQRTKLMS